jgi:hypothetical protein
MWYMPGSSSDWQCLFWCQSNARTNDDCPCGEAKVPMIKMIRDTAVINEFPWQVQVLERRRGGFQFVCSGALLDKNTVVTAAHCFGMSKERVALASPADYKIVVGKTSLKDPKDNVLISDADKISCHPHFSFAGGDRPTNDVAIVKLKNGINEYSEQVRRLNSDIVKDGRRLCYLTLGSRHLPAHG